MTKKRVLLFDWRCGWGIFFLVLTIVFLVTSLILLATASFINNFSQYLGNGFWCISHYSIKDLLFNWTTLDDSVITNPWQSHPFRQINIALIFLLFLVPFFLLTGLFLLIRWWLKTRI